MNEVLSELVPTLEVILEHDEIDLKTVKRILFKVDLDPKKFIMKIKRNRTYYKEYLRIKNE